MEELRSAHAIEIVEMDEMHTSIGSKKLLLDLVLLIVLGESSSSALLVLATRQPEKPSGIKIDDKDIEAVMTVYWAPSEHLVPPKAVEG